MNPEKISIALTTYNGGRHLRSLLLSIYNQTYHNFEVVVSDDCSNDDTIKILEEFKLKKELHYEINQKRLGFIGNFKKIINKCSSDIIALADQDDIWHPNKLEIQLQALRNYSLVCSDVDLIDESGKIITHSLDKKLHIPLPERENQFYSLIFINYVRGCTILFNRSIINEIDGFPEAVMSHDWWLGVLATRNSGINYLNTPLINYRIHSQNAIGIKKLWKPITLFKYIFSRERKDIFLMERERIKYYLSLDIFDENEKRFLSEIYEHYNNILNTKIHLKAVNILLRHKKRLYNNISPFYMYLYIFGRIL